MYTPLLISSIITLLVIVGLHHLTTKLPRLLRLIVPFTLAGVAATLAYLTALQYFTWASNGLSRLLLPPHQSISYFAFYALTEFWADYLLAAAIGLIAYLVIKRQTTPERPFFYPEEPALCFIALVVVGNPLWIIYCCILLVEALIGTCYTTYISKTRERVSFRYLWIPTAILVLAFSPILNKLPLVIYLHF